MIAIKDNAAIIGSTSLTNRAKIEELELAILAMPNQVSFEPRHYFAHGTYTRELFIPAGTLVTGKIHKYSCVNIISKGKILVITDEGQYELKAPHVFVSGPNVKKGVYAIEDTVWLNVHPWEGPENLELIEAALIIKPEIQKITGALCLGG